MKKYSREEYDSMSMVQHQQLYELQKKARLVKGKKTSESSRALEAIVAVYGVKETIVAMRDYLQKKSPKLITEIIQPLIGKWNQTELHRHLMVRAIKGG